ncbi:WD40 repeat domain-containing serine/threonine protein kinase [Novipirellula artificiosorum]|uniref:Serine/threonine-protein kinase PknB n=1 Tax=Novipirellula artificiosorum TaxID=2528016 RepID=A0A5C6E1A2_9BACT|nr:WD40 repeat domain-containing serine/threonine protein kinase [Novipirellula artificiosorum]TWU42688.1 Serine/threonine-protein kinase PknB [Novipirellula artificiosorum]
MTNSGDETTTSSSPDESSGISIPLQQLIGHWEKLKKSGQPIDPEELCEGDPDLANQLRDHIAMLEAFSRFEKVPVAKTPETIGEYKILKEIARGGTSIVYLAEQAFPTRKVALKLLQDVAERERSKLRFRLEAELLASLQHHNIARIFDAGVAEVFGSQRLFFTMEWIDGLNLVDFIKQQRKSSAWTHADTIRLCLAYMDALSEAHQAGVIHRDLKPANLMVTREGVPKLIDFGLARIRHRANTSKQNASTADGWIGTRCYMSPEQFSGEPERIDFHTDIYGFGVVLYELLAGRLPYQLKDKSMWESAQIVQNTASVPIGRVDRQLRGDIEVILETALAKDPTERYASITDFADDLRRYLDNHPIRARRQNAAVSLWKWCQRHRRVAAVSVVVLGLFLVLGVAAGLWATLASDRARKLADVNQQLETSRSRLQASNQRYAATAARLRRSVSNQTLLRLGTLLDQEPNYVLDQLEDESRFPTESRGFAWRLLHQSAKRSMVHWQADAKTLMGLAISDDGSWLATSGAEGIRVWDLKSQSIIAQYRNLDESPSVRLALDNQTRSVLLVRRDGGPIRLDVDANRAESLSHSTPEHVMALAATGHQGGYLIGTQSGHLEHWNGPGGTQLWNRQMGDAAVIAIAVSIEGDRFCVLTQDGDAYHGDLDTGEMLEEQHLVHPKFTVQRWDLARVSRDLRWGILCTEVGDAVLWDLRSKQPYLWWSHLDFYPDIDVVEYRTNPMHPRFLVSGRDRVGLWQTNMELAALYERRSFLSSMVGDEIPDAGSSSQWDPLVIDSALADSAVAIGLRGGTVVLTKASPSPIYDTIFPAKPTVAKLCFSFDGKALVAVSGAGHLSYHDVSSGEILWQSPSGARGVTDLFFAGNDRFLVTNERQHQASLRSASDGGRHAMTENQPNTNKVVLVGDRLLIGFCENESVDTAMDDESTPDATGDNIESSKPVHTRGYQPVWLEIRETADEGPTLVGASAEMDLPIEAKAYDEPSGLLATYDEKETIALWRIGDNDQLEFLAERHVAELKTMEFMPGGETLVVGAYDGSITLWSTPTLDQIARRHPNANQAGSIAISPDGSVMAVGYFDGEVLFWDTENWEPQLSVRTDLKPIRDLEFSPAGDRLAVGGKGQHLLMFHLKQ